MKGTSKVIMGATLVMVVTLAVVLALILVLLAELYCSLLLRRRRQLRKTNSAIPTATTQTTTTTTTTTSIASPPHTSHSHPQQQHHPPPPPPPPFSRIYSQGVLQAPRSFLVASCKEEDMAPKKLHSPLQQTQETNTSALRHVGVLLPFPSPPPCSTLQGGSNGAPCNNGGEHLVYISNPIYENEETNASGADTPFETPDTSPSRLERSDSSGDDGDAAQGPLCGARSPQCTPPLTPMKKLPAEACSVSLRDARSLDTSASDSRSNVGPSSSSSASPCTSTSW